MRALFKLATVFAFAVGLSIFLATVAETAGERLSAAPQVTTSAVPLSAATDALRTDYGDVPSHLWESLYDLGYRGDPTDGTETFYVPWGTVVDVPGGLYLATIDGWQACADNVTFPAHECSGTGPVVPLASHPVPGTYIPAAAPSGAPVVEWWEDGSASYADGLSFDPEERLFRLPIT